MIICMIRIYEADTALLPDEKAVLRNIVFLEAESVAVQKSGR